jgi:hypothetical protein
MFSRYFKKRNHHADRYATYPTIIIPRKEELGF